MNVRFRVAASPGDLFGAAIHGSVDLARVPEVGESHRDGGGDYRVVKVMLDVDPEQGSDTRGAIVYLVKIVVWAEPIARSEGRASLSLLVNTSKCLRSCIERADAARRTGSPEQYRRHVEEFLFLSSSASRFLGPGPGTSAVAPRPAVPYLPVYSESDGLASLLREGLIESRFAAHVDPVRSLPAVRRILERMDASRPTLFIVTEPLVLRSGLAAVHEIREHAKASRLKILVLAQEERASDETLAIAAGADAYASFPDTLDDHPALVALIRRLLESFGAARLA